MKFLTVFFLTGLLFFSAFSRNKSVYSLENGVWNESAPRLQGSFKSDTLALRAFLDSLGLKYRSLNHFLSGKGPIRVYTKWIRGQQRITGLEFFVPPIAESGASIALDFKRNLLQLPALMEIRSRKTDTEELPAFLAKLRHLQILEIRGGGLTRLPDSLTFAPSLRVLRIDDNYVGALPDSIGRLKTLEHLSLKGNTMRKLPASIGELLSLRNLELPDSLDSLPSQIVRLQKLRLDLKKSECKLFTLAEDDLQAWMREHSNAEELGCFE